jgi:hypothetical protein
LETRRKKFSENGKKRNGGRTMSGTLQRTAMENTPPPSRTLVFVTVSFYLVAALVMVFVNKVSAVFL